jgi:ethanolamine utilization microcompartment shell protein EutS
VSIPINRRVRNVSIQLPGIRPSPDRRNYDLIRRLVPDLPVDISDGSRCDRSCRGGNRDTWRKLMGREALVRAEVGTQTGEVKALLESHELILRGEIKRHFPRPAIENVEVDGGQLRFTCGGESIRLHLGDKVAASWAKAVATPPPSLRAKLGLQNGAKAFLIGTCDDAALAEALDGAVTGNAAEAAMLIARIDGPEDLASARAVQAEYATLPVWTIYPKGKSISYGDGAIRAALREAGFRDTKSCAVSDRLTATRYNPVLPKGR